MEPTLTTPAMRYWRMAPHPRLRSHVLCYFLAWPSQQAPAVAAPLHGEELLLPDGHSEIVFCLDGAFERWRLGHSVPRCTMRHSCVIGSRSHSVLTRDLGPVAVAGVKLDPRALRWLLGMPLAELGDATAPLRDVAARGLIDLEDAVANARSAGVVAAVLDRYLLGALGDLPPSEASVDQLLRSIRASRGTLSIMQWARQRRADARHLERRFAATIGMTPKRYARIVRFQHGYHALLSTTAEPPVSRRTVTAARPHLDGFYDQSHFNKEFRAFMGAAPTLRLNAALRQATSISDHLLAGELANGR
jgi:AraC-like DNA-binding protein